MARIITLTTDFGQKGPFVGVMKGAILRHAPDVRIIDLTHEIHVHWPTEAGFWLERAYRYFPAGAVHVAVVDPGVGTERDIVVVDYDGHIFLAPDNGLLPPAFETADSLQAWRLSADWLRAQNWPVPSNTFHGRDIFAPLAAQLAIGAIQPQDVGPRATELIPSLLEKPYEMGGELHGTVVTLDHFGNLITNIEETELGAFNEPEVHVAGHRLPLRTAYGNVPPGEFLALINSFGVVEIARAEGSAADGLGLGRGAPVIMRSAQS